MPYLIVMLCVVSKINTFLGGAWMTLGKQCQVITTSDRMTTLCYDVILAEVFALCSVSKCYIII